MNKHIKLYDNSRISDWRRCPRYFLLRHVYDFAPVIKSTALTFGSSWHSAMDVVWENYAAPRSDFDRVVDLAYAAFIKTWMGDGLPHPDELSPDDLDELSPRIPQIAVEMLYHYIDERQHIFKDKTFKLLEVERPFAVPLSPTSDDLFYVGRIDKIFELKNQVIGGEHKTSSSYRKGGPFRNEFLDSFSPNSQCDGYNFALKSMYPGRDTAIWVDAALVHKTIHDGFVLIPVDPKFSMLEAWLYETHYWIDQIEANKAVLQERSALNTQYLAAFPKDTGSCGNFGGCAMRDICVTQSNPAKLKGEAPLGYQISHWSPWNEIALEKLGFTTTVSE